MTVSSSVLRNDYTGNGVTTAFTGSFRILDQTHIQVLRTQISTGIATTLALTTDYTVSGVGASTFTVTCLTAPTSDQRLSILRNVPLTQLTDYVPNDPFPAESHEQALDKLTMISQQLQEAQSRALSLSANSVGVSATLPAAESAKILGWDGTGTALANYDAASLAGSVATINWTHDTFSGDGSQTEFTLTSAPGSADNCDVSISGVTQRSGTDYTVSGVTLTFTSAPPLGTNNIFVRYGSQLAAGVPGDGTVTAAKLTDAAIPDKINAASSKTTPIDADLLALVDSAASNALKKLTWADLKTNLNTLYALPSQTGNSGKVLKTNGTTVYWDGAGVLSTLQVTTSGSAINFTGIPSWVKRITVMFDEVSTTGTGLVQMRLGTSSGLETSGYKGAATLTNDASSVIGYAYSSVNSIVVDARASDSASRCGAITLTLMNSSTNLWAISGNVAASASPLVCMTAGTKALADKLDRLRIFTGDAFDVGSINIFYE